MVNIRDKAAEGVSGKVADQGHHRLGDPKGEAGVQGVFYNRHAVAHAVGDRYRKGIHRQAECKKNNQQQSQIITTLYFLMIFQIVPQSVYKTRPGAGVCIPL